MKVFLHITATVALALAATTVNAQSQYTLQDLKDVLKVDSNAKPTWFTVTLPETTQTITVYSKSSLAPIGTLASGSSFLSFGANHQIVTLAYNGQVAFIEANACEPKFPKIVVSTDNMNFPLPGTTLNERLKQRKNDLDAIKKDGSVPMYYGNDPEKASAMKAQEELLKKNQEKNGSSGGGNMGGGGSMGGGGAMGGGGGMR